MVLFSPYNWWYYGGFTDAAQMHNAIWRTALIVSREHEPVAVADMNFVWELAHTSWVEDVRLHSGATHPFVLALRAHENFYTLLFDTLKELKVADGTLGFEMGADISTYLSVDEYLMMRDALPKAKFVSADPAIWAQRMIKTPYEQNLIREGCRRACLCVRAAFDSIRPGVSEKDIHRAFWRTAVEMDLVESPHHATWLCFSSNPNETLGGHRWITGAVDRIIKEGDVGHCDCGPTYKMYQLDFQRAFCVGRPPKELLHYYNIGKEAYLETVEAMKPGVRLCDLFHTSVEALKKRDFSEGHTIVFIGHQEGLSNHEPPWVTAKEEAALRPGMVVAIEVGAFDPQGEYFGTMPEDILLVTETGTENLTSHLSHELYVVS
jgi:Xaa-Pro aminopeptidase